MKRMNDWLTAFSCYHESKRLRQCFFRFLRDLNCLQKLINLGLHPRLIKHFVGNLNSLTYYYYIVLVWLTLSLWSANPPASSIFSPPTLSLSWAAICNGVCPLLFLILAASFEQRILANCVIITNLLHSTAYIDHNK